MAIVALVIFAATYVAIALTRLPFVKRVSRPAAAFAGAVAMVAFGVLSFDEAIGAVDWGTIGLLLGMMVVVAGLSRDGYLERAASLTFGKARGPLTLLVAVVVVTGVASAVLVNDTAVLVLTPLVVVAARAMRLSPVPFLIAEAMASNIGSVPSVVGNPQNVIVALQSGIAFERFALHLLPVTEASGMVLVAVIWWVFRKQLRPTESSTESAQEQTTALTPSKRGLQPYASPVVTVGVIAAFATSTWSGVGLPVIALIGGAVILLVNLPSADGLLKRVDWSLLLFFAGLFVVMGGIIQQEFFTDFVESVRLGPDAAGVGWVHGTALVLSQVVSNVPFTVMMAPVVAPQGSDLLWLSLASAATLAGNLTLMGAVANLIVAQVAEKDGVHIGFREFAKAGVIVTVATMAMSWGLLVLQAETGWL
ncbi:MAG: SLC13 family permease [Chloroflexi bacterium]|nr:SLC13 family permease [Chloroflexota bacterium]